jgi:hypothetical protein
MSLFIGRATDAYLYLGKMQAIVRVSKSHSSQGYHHRRKTGVFPPNYSFTNKSSLVVGL